MKTLKNLNILLVKQFFFLYNLKLIEQIPINVYLITLPGRKDMNTKLKLMIPLCIIFVTLASAILAGSMSANKLSNIENTEVLASKASENEVLTKAKSRILNLIDTNLSESSKHNREALRSGIQNHMEKSDKGKGQKFRILLEHRLEDLQEIIDIEQQEGFREMSLDARIPATNILSDICAQYGIRVAYDLNGDIVMLKGMSGENIYKNEMVMDGQNIRLEFLIGALAAILGLIIICIYVAKKKQLFIKDGMYDGYNKEGFA